MLRVMTAALLAFVAMPFGLANAGSSRLWTERGGSASPLAQVPDFRALAKRSMPSVVGIQVEQRASQSAGDLDFFERFWGGQPPREYRNRGLGTGFLIRDDGLILTNNHVVENAASIEVTFTVGGLEKKFTARVLGNAPEYDVALIQTEEKPGASVLPLGDSSEIDIGDWVMAIGNPFGLDHSVSTGIVSAKGRRDIMPSGRRGLYDFIQTDAAINPGNSGGPLINMKGEVIGINTAINAAGTGIGFAIPINMVKAMLPELKQKGRFAKSWIGIKIQALNDALASSYGLERPEGALVSEVVPGGPGQVAGLLDGDVILEFDDKVIRNSSDLPLYASMAGVGRAVKLLVWRDGKRKPMFVTLTEFPTSEARAEASPSQESGKLGLSVHDITPELRKQFRLDERSGIVVTDVTPGASADASGLQPGDVILKLGGKEIRRARAFAKAVRSAKSGSYLRLQIARQGGRMFIALDIP